MKELTETGKTQLSVDWVQVCSKGVSVAMELCCSQEFKDLLLFCVRFVPKVGMK